MKKFIELTNVTRDYSSGSIKMVRSAMCVNVGHIMFFKDHQVCIEECLYDVAECYNEIAEAIRKAE